MNTPDVRSAVIAATRRAPRALAVALLFLATAACRSLEPTVDIDAPPPIPPGIDAAHLHFTRSQVHVGDVAPDFTLARIDGGASVTLSALRGRPVVVVFGSFT